MSIKREAPVQRLDPAVEAVTEGDPIYGGFSARRRARNMTPGQRRKRERDRQRCKATYDMAEELRGTIDQVAKHFSIPASQVAAVLLVAGLEQLKAGKVDLAGMERKPSRSPRYDWVLVDLPETPEVEIEKL